MHKPHSGVVLIAKFCINIVFFGCCMHFGHIAASLYAKWLNTDWTSYGSLWLPCHSTLDLLGNSVSSKTVQLMIFSVISAVAPHSFPPHTTSLVNGRAESGQWRNKHISCHNFANLRQYCFHPQVLSLHLIISSALSTNEIHILEKKTPHFKLNPNETISGRIGLHIRLTRNHRPCQTDSDIFQSINRQHDPRNEIWMSQYA